MAIHAIRVKQKLFGQDCINGYLVGTESTGTFAQAIDAAVHIVEEAYGAHLAPEFVEDWFIDKVTVQNVSSNGMPAIEIPFPPVSGVLTGDVMPSQVAALVHFRSNTARPNKSTKYLSGWAAGAMDPEGHWDGGTLAALAFFGDAMLGIQTAVPTMPLLIGRYYPTTSEISLANAVETYTIPVIPSQQKRRRIGRGS